MLTISSDEAEKQVPSSEGEGQKPHEESIELAFSADENHNQLDDSRVRVRVQVNANDWIDRLTASQRHILYART